MKLTASRYFRFKLKSLRPSQKQKIKEILRELTQNPQQGERGKEEWQAYRYLNYQDDYGKMLLCYRVVGESIRLLSLSQISLNI